MKEFAQLPNNEVLDNDDEKPHQCPISTKTLRQKRRFAKHKRTHMVEKQYKCSAKGKSAENSVPVEHKTVQAGENPCKCFEYGKKFGEHSIFATHKRIDVGGKPYECSERGKKFWPAK